MAIRDFMGIDVPAFKRFYKDSKKTNTNMKNRCYWAEKENNTYFCDGYMIICFKDTTLFQVARVFDLSFDDMPIEDKPAQDLAKIFSALIRLNMTWPMFLNGVALASVAAVKNPVLQKSSPTKKFIA